MRLRSTSLSSVSHCRFSGATAGDFSWVSNVSFRDALVEAANTGLVTGFSSPTGQEQYWLRGARYPNYLSVPGATCTRTGSRAGLDAAVIYPANVARVSAGSGLRVHGAGTNLVRSSDAPPTQSFTVTATAHTLSLFGTGSVTLSGVATGTLVGTGASNRVSLTFTPTAGTLTLTVSGSVTFAQVETGTFVTDYIPNANTGASASAGPDNVQLAASALPTSGPIVFLADLPAQALPNLTGLNSLFNWSGTMRLFSSIGGTRIEAGYTVDSPFIGGLTVGGARRVAVAWSPGVSARISANGSAVIVDTTIPGGITNQPLFLGNRPALDLPLNGSLGVFAIYRATPSDAQLQAMSAL
jgi:hypothetical protein